MYTTLSEGTEYYKHVDEVMSDPAAWQGKRMSLHGYVVDKSILAKPDTLEYRFQIQSNGKVVAARYTGVDAGHVQGWLGGRVEGPAGAARFRRVAERRDGQVPVEVRGQQDPRRARHLTSDTRGVNPRDRRGSRSSRTLA